MGVAIFLSCLVSGIFLRWIGKYSTYDLVRKFNISYTSANILEKVYFLLAVITILSFLGSIGLMMAPEVTQQ